MNSFTHSQVVLNLNEFISSVKQVIMNNVGNQNSGWSPVTSIFYYFPSHQSQCGPATVWLPTFLNIFCVQHMNKNEYRFGTTWLSI